MASIRIKWYRSDNCHRLSNKNRLYHWVHIMCYTQYVSYFIELYKQPYIVNICIPFDTWEN